MGLAVFRKRSQSNENDKTDIFNRFFLLTNFCVKIVVNTNKNKNWGGGGGQID